MLSLRALRSSARPAAAAAVAFRQTARPFHSTAPRRVVHDVKSIDEFNSIIEKEPKVLVDCFAEWCGPCKAIAPILSQLSDHVEVKDKVHFVKFDVDQLPDLGQELGIRAMPTFIFFEDGKKVDEMVGANPPVLMNRVRSFAG
ncbi:Thioredoxin-like protein [Hapsidospora chrysogenum ATCC 11550]|uniref:Thioredoxin-like protein n=1 Tax=Hapsidospora chrysogenum (strain ATCC 11550 / CBS 779.69 / DSM 880 / IAM 14645 / JCM 23072 / IMI 49137) TaxID=857340 RepID=A0A086T756_HAPC1|nr:Thioredoxin-like protein [Hapsidospora chrysogenum ATCC 11550]